MIRNAHSPGPLSRRFSIAPMMEWTDRHCRYFHRLLTRRALLYTEMLSTGAVLSGSLPELTGMVNVSAPVTLEEAERSHILQTLQQTAGVVGGRGGAAARLGLPRTSLLSKIKRLGINREQSSVSPVRAATSVPISEDPISRIPPLSEISQNAASPGSFIPEPDLEWEFTLADAERKHISEVVEMTEGLIAGEGGAAKVLGVPPSTLRSRMKKLGIKS